LVFTANIWLLTVSIDSFISFISTWFNHVFLSHIIWNSNDRYSILWRLWHLITTNVIIVIFFETKCFICESKDRKVICIHVSFWCFNSIFMFEGRDSFSTTSISSLSSTVSSSHGKVAGGVILKSWWSSVGCLWHP